MGELTVRRYAPEDEAAWDALVERSVNGTFLHTRRYLSYHGDRFADVSLVAVDGNRLAGVLPAAADPADTGRVVSHPGITYGGLVHDGSVRGSRMIGALRDSAGLWRESGFRALLYKVVPHIYHRMPAGDDAYALFRLGAARVRCDLSATVDLTGETTPRRDRRRNVRLAARSGVQVETGRHLLVPFWDVLTDTLRDRHGVVPVHTVEEIGLLADRFPEAIRCAAAFLGEELVAGVVSYRTDRVLHAQYTAVSATGRTVYALDLLVDDAIATARSEGLRYFDYGVSTERAGWVLNDSLYEYKLAYGAGGVPHEFYELDLEGGGRNDG